VKEEKTGNLVILDVVDSVEEKGALVRKEERGPWDWSVMLV